MDWTTGLERWTGTLDWNDPSRCSHTRWCYNNIHQSSSPVRRLQTPLSLSQVYVNGTTEAINAGLMTEWLSPEYAANARHTFQVQAENGFGEGDISNERTITTLFGGMYGSSAVPCICILFSQNINPLLFTVHSHSHAHTCVYMYMYMHVL